MMDDDYLERATARIQDWGRTHATPALVIVREALEHNIRSVASAVRVKGIALRPHAKTHKCLEIARLQRAHGAIGVCCAKVSEAEALYASGFDGAILITSPPAGIEACTRATRLHRNYRGVSIVVDHPESVRALAHAVGDAEPLDVLIDIDPGIHRTGVTSAQDAVILAKEIASHDALRSRGLQFYCGLQQHIPEAAQRFAAVEERTLYLRTILDALATSGFPASIVTGSGTGTLAADLSLGVFTEVQPGSAIFLDGQYEACEGVAAAFDLHPSLFIAARVISCNTPGLATLDAGYKAMASDAGPPTILTGPHAGARLVFMGDEHCAVVSSAQPFAWGEMIVLQPPHCDPTVNLYDAYTVVSVEDDAFVDAWPITARGCVR